MNFKKQIIMILSSIFYHLSVKSACIAHVTHQFFKKLLKYPCYLNPLWPFILILWPNFKKKNYFDQIHVYLVFHYLSSLPLFVFLHLSFLYLILQYSRFEFGHLGWVWISISRGLGCWTQILLLSIEAWVSFL